MGLSVAVPAGYLRQGMYIRVLLAKLLISPRVSLG